MYIVDNLINLYNVSAKGTTNSILSQYFLLNARRINHKKLLDVARETNLSNSSITRFCKSAGYDTFSSLCDMLDQDTRKIDYQFYHLLNENKNFNIEHDIKVKLDQLVHDLMKASNVIIYGSPKYTGYFDTLIKYLFFKGVCVERCLGWNIKEKEETFLNSKNDDVIILIDHRYNIQIFLEETQTSLGSITSIINASAKKYFFCDGNHDFSGIKAIELKKKENYEYILSSIEYANYVLYRLMKEENYEYSHI